MMIRNDRDPVAKPGYEPTGEGTYALCPDHGSRMWWSVEREVFYCPAEDPATGERLHDHTLAPADVYLEHDEAWRVVNGCLWIDTYDEEI